MSTTVPALTLRIDKGSPLTAIEGDKNLTILRDAINGAFAQLSVALKSDGTLKDNTVSTLAIIDRAVTNAKLAFNSSFYAVDTGVENAIIVTYSPAPTVYEAGIVLYVKVLVTNTGPVTIKVNTLSIKTIKKNGTADLAAGDLVAGQIVALAYDATAGTPVFQLTNTLPPVNSPWNTGIVSQQAGSMTTALIATTFVEIATIALTLPALKRWVWVKVVFAGIVPSGQKGIEFESAPIRHNGTGLSLVNSATPSGILTNSSDDIAAFSMTAEGAPTGYETANLDLEIRCRFPSGASGGDTPASRACYAVGWYTNV